jgi:hypothetical protein
MCVVKEIELKWDANFGSSYTIYLKNQYWMKFLLAVWITIANKHNFFFLHENLDLRMNCYHIIIKKYPKVSQDY